jgi:hypothetical protein
MFDITILQDTSDSLTQLLSIIVAGVTLAVSYAWGLVKKFTTVADTGFGAAVKPIQPLLVMIAGFALPLAAAKIGLLGAIPTGEAFVTAPLATVVAVTIRELWLKAKPKK